MIAALPPRAGYSRAESASDAVIHVVGFVAAAIAVPALIARAVERGEANVVAGTVVYGGSLVVMILCSALYNMTPPSTLTPILRRLDHSAIYVKIAGTYTAFAMLSEGSGTSFLIGLWAAAGLGATLRTLAPVSTRRFGLGLYVAMGWLGAAAGWSIFAHMSPEVFTLIVTAGILYTLGLVFYLLERFPFHYTIWHAFVLAASVALFVALNAHIASGPAAATPF